MRPFRALFGCRVWARRDEGITVVEVMVAALILVVSGIALLGLVDSATRNNFRAQQSQIVNDQLQQEIERIRQLPYDEVALTSTPTHSDDSNNPNSRIAGTTFNINRSGAANYEDLLVNGGADKEGSDTISGGTVAPGPTSFQSGDVSGQVYRYVTWEQDPSCGNCADEWHKHVVVAVTLDKTASGGIRDYQELQGNVSNPEAGLGSGPGPGPGGGDQTPWTFWLTDTPCDASGRQDLTGDHLTHNGLGDCPDGPQTGETAGAPDLMFTKAAPLDLDFPANAQPTYDYATDVEPAQNPDQDKGLQEKIPPNTISGGVGCLTNISSSTSLQTLGPTPQLYLHKWLSPPIPTGFSTIVLDGTGQLELWTRTINGAVYPGKICIWLFIRTTSGGSVTDTNAVNLDLTGNPDYFVHSQSAWPSALWTEIHVPLRFSDAAGGSAQLTPGDRLGLAFGVERQGTLPGDGLQFIYDHPTFDSRLEVDTHSVLPVF
jgi:Tfp pilus assembly protein PilV